MKALILVVLSLLMAVDPATVKKINATKEAAEDAFKSGNYAEAIRHYKTLVDSLGVNEDAVVLNLANAYYLAKDTANAFSNYQAVAGSPRPEISSKAHQQLGVMLNQRGKAEQALEQFKAAIKAEPSNDDARFNYEMLKKKLEEEKKKQQEQQQQNKDQQNKDQQKDDQQKKEDQQNKDQQNKDQQSKDEQSKDEQNKDQQQQDQEQKDQEQKEQQQKEQQEKEAREQQQQDARKEEMPNLDRQKLEEMKISEEKARMILEAMKNQERQYLQQQRRKATQPKDPNRPDW